jgi:hypothetical protein
LRILAAGGLLLVGAVTAVAAVALHELVWGFALSAAATVVTVLALPPGWLRMGFVLGWVVVVGWLTVPRAEGDYLISQDWQGYALLGIGIAVLVAAVATLPRPARHRP